MVLSGRWILTAIALLAHESHAVALCAHRIIETCIETPGNIYGNEGDVFILANK